MRVYACVGVRMCVCVCVCAYVCVLCACVVSVFLHLWRVDGAKNKCVRGRGVKRVSRGMVAGYWAIWISWDKGR